MSLLLNTTGNEDGIVNYYITHLVLDLFDYLRDGIQNRIDGTDYYCNWFQLVSFILFVTIIAHQKVDKKIQELVQKGIKYYLYDNKNPLGFLNGFGDEWYYNNLLKRYPEKKELSKQVEGTIEKYIETWNKSHNKPFAVNELFGILIATDNDRRNLHGSFNFIYGEFINSNIMLSKKKIKKVRSIISENIRSQL